MMLPKSCHLICPMESEENFCVDIGLEDPNLSLISQGNDDRINRSIGARAYFLKEQFQKARPFLFQTQPTLFWLKKINRLVGKWY